MKPLSPKQLHIARSMADVLFDGGEGIPAERLDYAVGELRDYSSRMGWQSRIALGFALWVVSFAPFLLWFQFRRFENLPKDRRLACLIALEQSKLGMLLVVLKTVLSMVYFEHPDALAATGYDGIGLLGPAYVEGSSPIDGAAAPIGAKLRVLVSETPSAEEATAEEEAGAALTPLSTRGAGGI